MSFADSLNRTCDIMRPATGPKDTRGNVTAPATVLRAAVPCRLSFTSRRAREYKSEKKTAIGLLTVFMAVTDVTEADYLVLEGKKLNIVDVAEPAGAGHHLELLCEDMKP